MALDLRANTAVDVLIGPFVDDSDGNTDETGLTITQADVRLSKNGQNMAQKNDANACTHDELGMYNCPLDATDTNTEGSLVLVVHESGALPVRHEFNVMAEAAWDSLYAAKDTGYMDVNIKAISEDTTAADNLESACDNYSVTRGLSGTALPNAAADAAGGLPISDAGGLDLDTQLAHLDADISSRGTADPGDNMNLADDAITSAKYDESTAYPVKSADTGATQIARVGADGDTLETLSDEIAALNDLSAADVNAEVDTALSDYDAPTKTEMDAAFTEIKGATWAAGTDTLAHIRDKETDIETDTQDLQTQVGTAGAGLTDLGGMSTGMKAEVNAEADTALSDYDPPTKAEMDTGLGLLATEAKQDIIDTNVDAIKAVTDNLPDSGALTTLLSNVSAILTDTGTTLDTKIDTIDGIVDSILALLDDARSEPGQGDLPENPDLATKIDYLYKYLRNKIETTSTGTSVYNSAGDTVDHKNTISDDGTTFTRGKFVSGP